jgi:hypothetical protein
MEYVNLGESEGEEHQEQNLQPERNPVCAGCFLELSANPFYLLGIKGFLFVIHSSEELIPPTIYQQFSVFLHQPSCYIKKKFKETVEAKVVKLIKAEIDVATKG